MCFFFKNNWLDFYYFERSLKEWFTVINVKEWARPLEESDAKEDLTSTHSAEAELLYRCLVFWFSPQFLWLPSERPGCPAMCQRWWREEGSSGGKKDRDTEGGVQVEPSHVPCSHSRAIPSFPSQLEWKIGLAWANTRGILNSPS